MSEREQREQTIAHLQTQHATLVDAVVDVAIAALHAQLAALEPTPSPEQRKQAIVLFADVSGYTPMSETLDAEQVSDIMNALWQRIDVAIVEHGGRIDKHLGEAGVGKSRLLYEFDKWLELHPEGVWYFKGRCTQQRQGVANGLLRDLFAFRFGIAESDPIEVVRGKLVGCSGADPAGGVSRGGE